MSNTSVDKFAECSYRCCDIKPNDEALRFGEGEWHDDYNDGQGILDDKDGSGWAKGYSNDDENHPAHYLSDVNIKIVNINY